MKTTDDLASLRNSVGKLISERIGTQQKLPTEQQMVENFHTNRSMLREVLSAYEAQGFIVSKQGSGRYARVPRLSQQIVEMWSIICQVRPQAILEVVDTRILLETSLLHHAIQNVSIEKLSEMAKLVVLMKERAERKMSFAEYDRQFHLILYSSLDNFLIEELLTAFWDLFDLFCHDAANRMEVALQHEHILDCLARRDVEGAQQLFDQQFLESRGAIFTQLMKRIEKTTEDAPLRENEGDLFSQY